MIEPVSPACAWAPAVKQYIAGTLALADRGRVRAHLASCPVCSSAGEAEMVNAVLAETARSSWWRAAGQALVQWVRRLLPGRDGANAQNKDGAR